MSPPEDANRPHDSDIILPGSAGREPVNRPPSNGQALVAALLSNQVMVIAYAVSIVILAIGLVGLTVMLVWLCFFYPKQANEFLILLGGPLAAVLIAQSAHMKQILKDQEKKN